MSTMIRKTMQYILTAMVIIMTIGIYFYGSSFALITCWDQCPNYFCIYADYHTWYGCCNGAGGFCGSKWEGPDSYKFCDLTMLDPGMTIYKCLETSEQIGGLHTPNHCTISGCQKGTRYQTYRNTCTSHQNNGQC